MWVNTICSGMTVSVSGFLFVCVTLRELRKKDKKSGGTTEANSLKSSHRCDTVNEPPADMGGWTQAGFLILVETLGCLSGFNSWM